MKWDKLSKASSKTDFQTPLEVCLYMAKMIPSYAITVLEPTPGVGNLVAAVKSLGNGTPSGYRITAPDDFFELDPKKKFDCIIMNPPFSTTTSFGVPDELKAEGMKIGYHILFECMKRTDSVIALMPWFVLTDSDLRLREIKRYGIKSITSLPRKTFNYCRIQTCILELRRGWTEDTLFKVYEFEKETVVNADILHNEIGVSQ